ncbi:hypothetical protein MMC28_008697 [Mycoblastus sanguinarius]|nr:hypothetical protein [Mycoblastus sanguinarius]
MASSTASNPFDGVNFDWENYINHRPTYSSSFYELIWRYHESHCKHWNLAHDVGTGPGNVAEVLVGRFDKVIASDPSEYHISVARKRLASEKVTVERCQAENLAHVVGPSGEGKADMITLAECIPLMDQQLAFSGFAKLLRPGGTLAIWFYGRPIFAEKGQEKSQEIYDRITAKAFDRVRPIGKDTVLGRANMQLAGWLDAVSFPLEDWADVQRTKWNYDKSLSFLGVEYFDCEFEYNSNIRPDEKVEERVDRSFWVKEECGVDWAKGFIDAQLPWKATDDGIDAQLKPLYEELEAAMGGKGSKRKITWPVILMLATRK